MTSVDVVVRTLAAIASDKVASASARGTDPTNLFSPNRFTTGTFRCSLASNVGSASINLCPGHKHGGSGRITSYAITAFISHPAFKYSFKSCNATTPSNLPSASTTGKKLFALVRNRSATARNVAFSRTGGTGARIKSPIVCSVAAPSR